MDILVRGGAGSIGGINSCVGILNNWFEESNESGEILGWRDAAGIGGTKFVGI